VVCFSHGTKGFHMYISEPLGSRDVGRRAQNGGEERRNLGVGWGRKALRGAVLWHVT
jgi:hypothetical protein